MITSSDFISTVTSSNTVNLVMPSRLNKNNQPISGITKNLLLERGRLRSMLCATRLMHLGKPF